MVEERERSVDKGVRVWNSEGTAWQGTSCWLSLWGRERGRRWIAPRMVKSRIALSHFHSLDSSRFSLSSTNTVYPLSLWSILNFLFHSIHSTPSRISRFNKWQVVEAAVVVVVVEVVHPWVNGHQTRYRKNPRQRLLHRFMNHFTLNLPQRNNLQYPNVLLLLEY